MAQNRIPTLGGRGRSSEQTPVWIAEAVSAPEPGESLLVTSVELDNATTTIIARGWHGIPHPSGAPLFPSVGDTVAIEFDADGNAWCAAWEPDSWPEDPGLEGGEGGTSDHGALTGLGDDDHPQYHNNARGDARYWQLTTDLATQAELDTEASTRAAADTALDGRLDTLEAVDNATQAELDAHKSSGDHDGRYYTESEADALLATKAAASHTHVAADVTDFDTQVRTSKIHQLATPTAATPMGGQKFTGLGAGSANGDSLRYEQLFTTSDVTLLGTLQSPSALVARSTSSSSAKVAIGWNSGELSFGLDANKATLTRGANDTIVLGSGDTLDASGGTLNVATVAIGAGSAAASIGAVNTALGAYLTSAAAAAAYQPLDADLTTIAGLDSGTSAGVMTTDGAGWLKKSYAGVKTLLGLVKADVGLGNVDNTADTDKPVSTAQQAALDLKANLSGATFTGPMQVENSGNEILLTQGSFYGYESSADTQPKVALSRNVAGLFLGAGGSSALDWGVRRTAADVATLDAGDDLRRTDDGTDANSLIRKAQLVASGVTIADAGGYFTGGDVESALQELGGISGGTPAASAVTVEPSGLIVARTSSVQQALVALEQAVDDLRDDFEGHAHVFPGAQVQGGWATAVADSAGAGDKLSFSVTGDGVTPMMVRAQITAYQSGGAAGSWVRATVRDGSGGTGTAYGRDHRNLPTGYAETFFVEAQVPPFTGSKTFYLYLDAQAGTANAFDGSAGARRWMRATWAPGHPTS